MQILIDSYTPEISDNVIPEDVEEFKILSLYPPPGKKAEEPPTSESSRQPILDLDRWEVNTNNYQQEAAGKIGFLTGLVAGSGKRVAAGVIHETKWYHLQKTSENRDIEIGVSVRLSVATTALNTEFELSIPSFAAQAQLGMSDARIGISVVGFVGAVGDLLPAPEDLNVANFSIFTNAAKEIQQRVFGPDGLAFIRPTILSFEENTP